MKKIYTTPYTETLIVNIESYLAVASPKDKYQVGGEDSKWPESGDIQEDFGDGPGVSR